MNYSSKLMKLLMSNVLPYDEKTVAESLFYSDEADKFLEEAKIAPLVLVPSRGVPTMILNEVLERSPIKFLLFPTVPVGIMSPSPMETARHMSSTVCSLLKKIFVGGDCSLKGVLTIHSGIYLNGFAAPGALIWMLRDLEFLCFHVQSLDLFASAAFMDAFTMTPSLKSVVVRSEVKRGDLNPNQVISLAWDVIEKNIKKTGVLNGLTNLVQDVIPSPYHTSGSTSVVDLPNLDDGKNQE